QGTRRTAPEECGQLPSRRRVGIHRQIPFERGASVLAICVDALEPEVAVGPSERRRRRELAVERRVAVTQGVEGGGVELLGGVLPQRLEHAEAYLLAARLDRQHRALAQLRQRVQRVRRMMNDE